MMITVRARRITAVAVALVCMGGVGGCSREQQDWRAAEGADTAASYGQFIEQHPESELVKEARARIAQLAEDRDWSSAGKADTEEEYRQFLGQHPTGKWAQEARIRLQNFALNAATTTSTPPAAPGIAPAGAAGAAGAAAASNALPPPSAMPAATSVASPVESARPGYGIQLGAFTSEDRANAEWQSLQGRFAAELQGLMPRIVAVDTEAGRIFRLQAQAGDEARARLICEELRQRSQACVPVIPH